MIRRSSETLIVSLLCCSSNFSHENRPFLPSSKDSATKIAFFTTNVLWPVATSAYLRRPAPLLDAAGVLMFD
jgi:hypothetical protein